MYYPYFRGKQYELITIRETAEILARSNFVPIIEPVKETLNGLSRTLQSVCTAGGRAIVIVNPIHGDHSDDGANISQFLHQEHLENDNICAGVLLTADTTVEDAMEICESHEDHPLALIHTGFSEGRALADALGDDIRTIPQIFINQFAGISYRRHFRNATRILVRDGFIRRRNRDHPDVEKFSDLHVTFEEEGAQGFGDFLIAGDDFMETGGPAYAVAIHLTFIDHNKDDEMFIYHFKSDRQDTPTDPAGKFGEALNTMIATINRPNSQVLETSAIREFRELHANRHFPGLGYIKKLSMKHHIETLADFFQ